MLDNSTSTSGQRSCIQLLSTATECACAFRVFFCIFIPFQEDYGDACFPVRLKLMSSNRTAGTFLDAGRKVSIPGLVLLATSRPSNYAVSDFTRGTPSTFGAEASNLLCCWWSSITSARRAGQKRQSRHVPRQLVELHQPLINDYD